MDRIENVDWNKVATDVNETGWSMLRGLLTASEAAATAAMYSRHADFAARW